MDVEGVSEFLAVAEVGNFTRAAEVLRVSVAHVSRKVSALEARLGLKLFQRSTRVVLLTPEGEDFRLRCARLRDEFEELIQGVSAQEKQVKGRIRLAALSGSFAEQVVAPTLARFAADFPEVDLVVDVSTRQVDLRQEGYDLAIRSGPLADSSLMARPLARRVTVAAASPDYLAIHGVPTHPNELMQHQCIMSSGSAWRFVEGAQVLKVPISGRFRANNGALLRAACERGLGVAYMASAGFGAAFAAKTLVPILMPFWQRAVSVYIVYPDRRFVANRVRLLMDYLAEDAAQAEMREMRMLKEVPT